MGIQDSAIQDILSISKDMAPLQKESMQFALDSGKTAYGQSQSDREWMLGRRENLTGLQDTMLADAQGFNEDGRADQLAGQAQADVTASFDNAAGIQSRNLARMGINPSAGKSLAMGNQTNIARAVAGAGAANKAREGARLEGYSLTDRAANTLSGYPEMATTTTGSGASIAANGVNIANAGTEGLMSGNKTAASVAGSMGSNASSMWGAQSSYKNGQDSANQGDSPAAIMGGLGGMAMGFAKFSDRRLKANIELVGKDEATGLNLYEFNYTTNPKVRFRGVMADEVLVSHPGAVVETSDGYLAVDYSQLGIEMVEV
jgi:hypothetical protein